MDNDIVKTTGLKHTESSKERIRQATKKRWEDPNWRAKIVEAQKAGRATIKAAMTEEDKRLRSENRSKTMKQGYADGTRGSNVSYLQSEEFRQRNRVRMLAKWKDPEYVAKIKEALVGKLIGRNKRAISVDGVEYQSISHAAKFFGISRQSVMYRLSSANYPTWVYV